MFGTVPPPDGQRQEHSFPARPFDLGLDGERAFVGILHDERTGVPGTPVHPDRLSHPLRRTRSHGRHRPPARPPPPAHHGPARAPGAVAARRCGCSRAAGRRPGSPSRPSTGAAASWRRPWRSPVASWSLLLLATAAVARIAGGDPSPAAGEPLAHLGRRCERGRGGCAAPSSCSRATRSGRSPRPSRPTPTCGSRSTSSWRSTAARPIVVGQELELP